MSVAPVPKPPVPEVERVQDPFRAPKVRQTMHLIVPRVVSHKDGSKRVAEAKVSVTESLKGVRLSVDTDNDGIGVRHVDLTISEASVLADLLNRVRRRVVDRKEWRP